MKSFKIAALLLACSAAISLQGSYVGISYEGMGRWRDWWSNPDLFQALVLLVVSGIIVAIFIQSGDVNNKK